MNLVELINEYRDKSDDLRTPYLMTDAKLIPLFNQAEEEACIRGRLLKDERTVQLTSIPVASTYTAGSGTLTAGTYYYRVSAINPSGETLAHAESSLAIGNNEGVNVNWSAVEGATGYKVYGRSTGAELYMATVDEKTLTWLDDGSVTPVGALPTSNTTVDVVKLSIADGDTFIPYHASIIEINHFRLIDSSDEETVLDPTDRRTLDNDDPDWRTLSEKPTAYIKDNKVLRLNRESDDDYTGMLDVIRKPIQEMSSTSAPIDEPEINKFDHIYLVDWVLYRVYLMRDSDLYSPEKSAEHLDRFTGRFGERPTSDRRTKQEKNRPHHNVSYFGF